MDAGKIALLLIALFGLGMLHHYALRYAERAESWLRRHSWRDPFRGDLAARMRNEATALERQLLPLLARRNQGVANLLDEAGLRLDDAVARELARFLVLRRALPRRGYRVFGPVETFWAWLAEQSEDGAALLEKERFAPREVGPSGEWRARYGAFLNDYVKAFGESPDPALWHQPPTRGRQRRSDARARGGDSSQVWHGAGPDIAGGDSSDGGGGSGGGD